MSDDSQKDPEGGSGPVAGELLARARLAREISLPEIAKNLHLDEGKVRALEQNEFDVLGAPVFAKGYLRKYAELVGVPVDDVIADYYRLNRASGVPPLVTNRPRPGRGISPGPWLAAAAVVLAAGLGAAWWFSAGADWFRARDTGPDPAPAAERQAEAPAEEASGPDDALPDDGPLAPVAEPTPDEAARTQAAPSPAETSPAVDPPTGAGLELRLAFSGDCWTEVTDAGGERLYFGLGAAGDEVAVAGEPPLNVLLGNAANVAVFVDGAAYPIPASSRRGVTARLTLEAR